ncbi:MAG: hypothetical protein AB1603_07140 [Chloroflexota bacterium]
MGTELSTIFKRLNDYFGKHKVVSEDEIALAVSIEVSKLSPETRKKLEGELKGGDLEQVLVSSIVGEPISVYSPNLTSKRNYLGETFYHYPTHEFLADELEEAFKRLAKIRAMGALDTVEDIVGAFLSKSGYEVVSRPSKRDPLGCREMSATKGEKRLFVFVVPSVNFVAECASLLEEGKEYAMALPTEKTPAPFIRFCHEQASEFEGKKLQIWVVDPERKTVNPFLGYTHDDDIFKNFDDPKMAAFACRMYGVGKDLWVRSG